jgi:5-formyltetrahydrofolate cyclo-ligase
MQNFINASSKNEFRKISIQKLKIASKNRLKRDKVVMQRLEFLIKKLSAKSILLYLPLKIESDISKLIIKLSKTKNLFVPFMDDVSFKMVRYRLPLYKKKFNILEPSNSNFEPKSIDIAIVPVIGIDREFKRVGFGKGMYDRFFSRFDKIKHIIFVQRSATICKNVISNSYDIRGDYLVTSDKLIKNRKGRFDNIYINMYNSNLY